MNSKSGGFSLVEVLVIIGVISVVAGGIVSMLTNTMSQQKGIQAKDQQRNVTADVRSLLSNKTACLNTFGGQNVNAAFTVNSIKDAGGTDKFVVGTHERNDLLAFDEFKVENWDDDAGIPTQGRADLNIKLSKVGNTLSVRDLRPESISLKIKTNAAGLITECFTLGGTTDGFWQPNPVNTSDIFYSGGNVGIGLSAPTEKLQVAGNILVNGNLTGTGFYFTSDASLKTEIKALSLTLPKVSQLNPVTFTWKDTRISDMGLIAQEVEKIYPSMVHTDNHTGLKSVKYANLVAPLIEATKELYRENSLQQKKIDTLEAEMLELKAQVQALKGSL